MKKSPLAVMALLGLGLLLFSSGCVLVRRQAAPVNRPVTYALVVSVNGGQPPTDAQWAMLHKHFAAILSARGATLITDPTFADKLIHVQFFPEVDDPTAGQVFVVGVRNNPTGSLVSVATASPRTIPASYGYGYSSFTSGPIYPYSSYFSDYYGYFTDYPTTVVAVNRPAGTHPHHPGDNHTTKPIDCLPGTPHRTPTFANHPPSDGSGRGRSYPRSEPGYASSYSSNSTSYSSPVYNSPSAPSSSSSYSPPSISMSSSSSYSSSYSSPVYDSPSSSSSSSYSAPSISMSSPSSSSESSTAREAAPK